MIDFRYHLVSLISVFLALAVGIVLGAGPLRDTLGDQLAGQVEQLRTERDDMRVQNDRLTAQNDELAGYVAATAPQLVTGRLPDVTVAIISDDAATGSDVQEMTALLTEAGAATPVQISLTSELWSPESGQARATAVTQLSEQVPELALTGNTDAERIAAAIPALLSDDTGVLVAEQRTAGLQILADNGLLTIDGDIRQVDAVIVAGADPGALLPDNGDSGAPAEESQALLAVQGSLLESLTERNVPAVIAGTTSGTDDSTGMIRLARGDSRFVDLSSVDGLQRAEGPVVTVLALVEQLDGGSGHYGTGADASARVPEIDGVGGGAPTPEQPGTTEGQTPNNEGNEE
ncbi:MAG: copper transporter [Brachybacterium sp.]|nr:copper transporter [Brachybacterium sp.]